jgi:hypothetical protein
MDVRFFAADAAEAPATRPCRHPRARVLPNPAGPLAQLAEQWTFNPSVRGSSPRGPTTKFQIFQRFSLGGALAADLADLSRAVWGRDRALNVRSRKSGDYACRDVI